MRMLVLGAGGVGGYFGGRALEHGMDVTFLVRPGRAAQLARDGLVVESPAGDIRRPVQAVTEAGPGHDVVLLTAKAYDLDSAMAAIRPAVEAGACVLPILNGMAHMDALNAAFGTVRVWGGLARISATLTPEGVVRHSGQWSGLVCGAQDGSMDGKPAAFAALLRDAKGMKVEAVPNIVAAMWEKLVFITTLAGATVLFRATVGDIQRAGGEPLVRKLLERNMAVAAAMGHPVDARVAESYVKTLVDPAATTTASLLRDLEKGGRTEADEILGYMTEAAARLGINDELQRAAWVHARAQAERRAREGG
jgi:2-dehydropantoate 2-reductase